MAIGNTRQPGSRGRASGAGRSGGSGRSTGSGRAPKPKPNRDPDFEESEEDIQHHKEGQEVKETIASSRNNKLIVGVIVGVVVLGAGAFIFTHQKPKDSAMAEDTEQDTDYWDNVDDEEPEVTDNDVQDASDANEEPKYEDDWEDEDTSQYFYNDDGEIVYKDGYYTGVNNEEVDYEESSQFTKDFYGANVPRPTDYDKISYTDSYANYTLHKAFYSESGAIVYWVELTFDDQNYIQQVSAEVASCLKKEGICAIRYEKLEPSSGGIFVTNVEVIP